MSNDLMRNDMQPVIKEIKDILEDARNNVARQVNNELIAAYWNIGRIIVDYEQTVPERADYGKQTLKELAKELTKEFGKGFSRSNLQNMHWVGCLIMYLLLVMCCICQIRNS